MTRKATNPSDGQQRREGQEQQRHPHAGDLVDHDQAGVLAARRRRATQPAAATPSALSDDDGHGLHRPAPAPRIGQNSASPTADPAVPGAKGEYPEPRPVATAKAAASSSPPRRGAAASGEDIPLVYHRCFR